MTRKALSLILVVICVAQGSAQESSDPGATVVNRNSYYAFPLSIGASYTLYSDLGRLEVPHTTHAIEASATIPVPRVPTLQPYASLGAVMLSANTKALEAAGQAGIKYVEPFSLGAAAGMAVSHRLGKLFEVGVSASVGGLLSMYSDGNEETEDNAYAEWQLRAGASVTVSPIYNLAIEIAPSILYRVAPGGLPFYDGLYGGGAFQLHFRIGDDPDAGAPVLRSIRFGEPELQPLFAAMHSYYQTHPVGSVSIENVDSGSVTDVEVSFFQADYMHSPTPAQTIASLEPGEQIRVDFPATFNENIFTTEGDAPLTGEIIVTYRSGGQAGEQRRSVSYTLHDMTRLTWDDDRKVGAFITPSDSNVRRFGSEIRQLCADAEIGFLSTPLQMAMQAYHGIAELGIIYQADPENPFTSVQEDQLRMDSITLPREMLTRVTGDCDDLTVLYDSILEAAGAETGFVTIPGHIYAAINTEVPAREYVRVHPDRDMTIVIDNELWVLIEITLVGREDFLEAWRTGMDQYHAYAEEPDSRVVYRTRAAQELYRPVVLKRESVAYEISDPERLRDSFGRDLVRLGDRLLSQYRDRAAETQRPSDRNRLGIMAAQLRRFEEAERAFRDAITDDPDYLAARVNLGSLYYVQEQFDRAAEVFAGALRTIEASGASRSDQTVKVILNLARATYELEEFDRSAELYARARQIDADASADYGYLAHGDAAEGSRAAESSRVDILFLD